MADFRQVYTKIWADTWFTKLLPDEKLLFIYLFTNSRASVAGIYELPELFIQFETGLTAEQVGDALKKFQASGKVKYDPSTSVIWVLNMRKYQDSKSPKIASRIAKDFEAIPECAIKNQYAIQYGYSMDTVSIGYPQTADRVSIGYPKNVCDTDTDTEIETEMDTSPAPADDFIPFSQYDLTDKQVQTMKAEELVFQVSGVTLFNNLYDMSKIYCALADEIALTGAAEMRTRLSDSLADWVRHKNKNGRMYNKSNPGWIERAINRTYSTEEESQWV